MTSFLKLNAFKVINHKSHEGIGIFFKLEKIDKTAICPCCGSVVDKLHQNHWRVVKDLPWGEQAVYLQVNSRQVRCDFCGKIFTEDLGIVKKNRTHTIRLTNKIISEVLSSDVKNVAKRNEVSEQEIETMLQDKYDELREEKPKNLRKLGIDEIAVVKGQKNYYTVLVDLEKRVVVGIIEKRTKQEIKKYLEAWGAEVISSIEEVSIDLWQAYKSLVKELMPQAEIIADRFHVMKQVNEELDAERKKIKREIKEEKDPQKKERLLEAIEKSKYALLKNEEDLKESEQEKIVIINKELPKLGEMHQQKEKFREVFEQSNDWLEGILNLGEWLADSKELFPDAGKTVKRWISEIIAYFDERTTQGVVEGINNKLKLIKRRAFGFRNFKNFEIRAFLTWHFSS